MHIKCLHFLIYGAIVHTYKDKGVIYHMVGGAFAII